MINPINFIREAFYYQSHFNKALLVFKIDFPLTEHPAFPYLLKDIALLASTGFRIVIVPGAKERIDAVLAKYDVDSPYSGNIRITTAQSIPFVEMAAFHVATRFMTGLQANNVDAIIGNFIRARGVGVIDGLDFEHTGAVAKILSASLNRMLDQNVVVILPCIGLSISGKVYNVVSDEIARLAATALNAAKLFILSAHDSLHRDLCAMPETVVTNEGGRVLQLNQAEAEWILAANIDKPMQDLRLALQACDAGIERVHMLDGREDGAILLELFSNRGCGTMVYANEYGSIRQIADADITDVLHIMDPFMQQGILVRRTFEDIQKNITDYIVFEIDGSVHACCALHVWEDKQGEIAALATDTSYANMGLGRRIVKYCIDKATNSGLKRLFILTTRAQDWFESLGFTEVSVESLPPRRQAIYNTSRKSKVFARSLNS